MYEYPGYRCGPCPPGLQGNGTHCRDINEVGARVRKGTGCWGGGSLERFPGGVSIDQEQRDGDRADGGRRSPVRREGVTPLGKG